MTETVLSVRSIMKKIIIACIRFYRKKLSRLKGKPCCKYYPTCSEYALCAFETCGFFRASGLSLWRILRCNPWSMGGVDYVPGTADYLRYKKETEKKIGHHPKKEFNQNENNQ